MILPKPPAWTHVDMRACSSDLLPPPDALLTFRTCCTAVQPTHALLFASSMAMLPLTASVLLLLAAVVSAAGSGAVASSPPDVSYWSSAVPAVTYPSRYSFGGGLDQHGRLWMVGGSGNSGYL